MEKQKEQFLKEYYQLTSNLLETDEVELIEQLLQERDQCIEKVNELDQRNGAILMSEAIKEELRRIHPLERKLQEKLTRAKQTILAVIGSLQKEKTIKQQYGEPVAASVSGIFYDKRK
ncbi:hypothetical protein ACFPA1_22860 [Neobacillus sp. GCM10023253]|uniref:hypothetical protein n=1 Tax=Neobacillus sp. GCM10023253 TaxID=3252644 RepID=UPI00360E3591